MVPTSPSPPQLYSMDHLQRQRSPCHLRPWSWCSRHPWWYHLCRSYHSQYRRSRLESTFGHWLYDWYCNTHSCLEGHVCRMCSLYLLEIRPSCHLTLPRFSTACTIAICVHGSFSLKTTTNPPWTWAKVHSTLLPAPTATKTNLGSPDTKNVTSSVKSLIAKSGSKSRLFGKSRTPSSCKL